MCTVILSMCCLMRFSGLRRGTNAQLQLIMTPTGALCVLMHAEIETSRARLTSRYRDRRVSGSRTEGR